MTRDPSLRRVRERVPMEEAKRRAVEHGRGKGLLPASDFAGAIWPGAEWRAAQGAGAAASRILKALERDGRARWRVEYQGARAFRWGWEVW